MKPRMTILARTIASLMIAGGIIQQTMADDIDLYITSTTGSADVQPNVLFIIDNSGSMDTVDVPVSTLTCVTEDEVEITGFDPSLSYEGDYDTNRIYFFDSDDDSPSEGGDPSGSLLSTDNYCNTSKSSLDTSGVSLGQRLISYRKHSGKWGWRSVREEDNSGIAFECRGDEGNHGETDGDSKVYATEDTSSSSTASKWTSTYKDRYDDWKDRRTYDLYNGNYLNYASMVYGGDPEVVVVLGTTEKCTTSTTNQERMKVVKDVATSLINNVNGINLGIMSFNPSDSDEGGIVIKEVVDINGTDTSSGKTNKELLKGVVSNLSPKTWTPLGETLYEAGRYLKGDTPKFGSSSVASAMDGTKYKSPITDSCQANNTVILLTDGEPTEDSNYNSHISSYIDDTCNQNGYSSKTCLVEVAKWMANTNLSSLTGTQSATVHTIGFKTDQALLKATAAAGNGNYYVSNDYAELESSLSNIISRILASDSTFISPAVSVNAFNRLQHNREIYYAMFAPGHDARWDGNIKKYRIGDDGKIMDQNDNEAISSLTGFFKDTAHSYWSTGPDGKTTISGGARNKQLAPRKVLTYTGASSPATATALDVTAHKVDSSNTALTNAMLGVADDTEKGHVINWARGYDEDGTTPIKFIGDPLHSRPVVVVYGGTDSSDQDTTLFFGTNEGFLHAIDGEDGKEQFAFIPQALLPNLKKYYSDTAGDKTYGLDGEVAVWKNDVNNNGVIYDKDGKLETGESVYLYVGMRRGGRNYYALDVTDRSNPKLMWQIVGGSGDFTELGQSWGKPSIGKVKINGVAKNVVFFTGGYDEDQDDATVPQADDVGRAIYMVDALTGALLWSAGPHDTDDLKLTGMTHSFPAGVRTADVGGDGYTDILFASNVGGEVWRFDFNLSNTGASTLATGGKILDINNDTTEAENRKFFSSPEIAAYAPRGGAPHFLVAIGSGTRPDPLDTDTVNHFYVFREYSPFKAPVDATGKVTYTTLTESDLYDATKNLIQVGDDTEKATAITALNAAKGWHMKLEGIDSKGVLHGGEKSMVEASIFGGNVMFTTYTPDFTATGTACELNLGVGKLYALNILDGTASEDLNNDGKIDSNDRFKELNHEGIPPGITNVFIDDKVYNYVGSERHEMTQPDLLHKVYWREEF